MTQKFHLVMRYDAGKENQQVLCYDAHNGNWHWYREFLIQINQPVSDDAIDDLKSKIVADHRLKQPEFFAERPVVESPYNAPEHCLIAMQRAKTIEEQSEVIRVWGTTIRAQAEQGNCAFFILFGKAVEQLKYKT